MKTNDHLKYEEKLILTLLVPVVLLYSPNSSPYFSTHKFERILLYIFSSLLCLINCHFLITKWCILYVLCKEKLSVDTWLGLKGLNWSRSKFSDYSQNMYWGRYLTLIGCDVPWRLLEDDWLELGFLWYMTKLKILKDDSIVASSLDSKLCTVSYQWYTFIFTTKQELLTLKISAHSKYFHENIIIIDAWFGQRQD